MIAAVKAYLPHAKRVSYRYTMLVVTPAKVAWGMQHSFSIVVLAMVL